MDGLIPPLKQGLCFILSAPAGTGKTTLAKMLSDEFPVVAISISYTTRKPREGEIDGQHYYFISKSEFLARIASGDFLEYVELYGDYYGTSKAKTVELLNAGRHVYLVIDTQGARKLKGHFEVINIFVSPPSLEILRKRLTERKTETAEIIAKRLAWAENEMRAIPEYDYNIVNDNLQTAYQALRSILIAECHRVKRLKKQS